MVQLFVAPITDSAPDRRPNQPPRRPGLFLPAGVMCNAGIVPTVETLGDPRRRRDAISPEAINRRRLAKVIQDEAALRAERDETRRKGGLWMAVGPILPLSKIANIELLPNKLKRKLGTRNSELGTRNSELETRKQETEP